MKWFCLYWLLKVNDCNILPGQKQTSYNAHYDHCYLIGLSCCDNTSTNLRCLNAIHHLRISSKKKKDERSVKSHLHVFGLSEFE